jgi:hypothetical protein
VNAAERGIHLDGFIFSVFAFFRAHAASGAPRDQRQTSHHHRYVPQHRISLFGKSTSQTAGWFRFLGERGATGAEKTYASITPVAGRSRYEEVEISRINDVGQRCFP